MPQTTILGFENGYEEMEANTMEALKNTSLNVRYTLERYPETKGCDNMLIARWCNKFHGNLVTIHYHGNYENLKKIPAFESVRRCRQKIQEGGEFLPTEKTVIKRRRREEIIRNNIHSL